MNFSIEPGSKIAAVMVEYRGDKYLPAEFYFTIKGLRTKGSHPYNYDAYMQYLADDHQLLKGSTVYTDRMLQWDYEKTNNLMQKHFGNQGQYWDDREPEVIEAFLRDWRQDPNLRLIAVIEYCNQASGYPVWRLDYTCAD